MIEINGETTMVGSVELRTAFPKIAKHLKHKKVIILNRGQPIAILEDFAEHARKEKMIEVFEDLVLGHLAKGRADSSTENDFIDEDTLAQKLDIKL